MLFRNRDSRNRRCSYQLTADPESQDNDKKAYQRKTMVSCTHRKGTGPTALLKNFQGSLSLEAAVVLPLFLMTAVAFYSLFGIMITQLKLQTGMERVGRDLAACRYAFEKLKEDPEEKQTWLAALGEDLLLTVVSEGAVKELVKARMGDYADEMLVSGGENGVSFLGTRFSRERQEVILMASYELTPFFLPVRGILLTQQSVHRAFTGKTWEKKTEEQIVYITTYGKVYHTSLSCNYLDLSIISVGKDQVGSRRNVDGGKYYECEMCEDREQPTVFITSYGDRYHYDRNCSGLKRSITSVPISQVEGRTYCKKCERRDAH